MGIVLSKIKELNNPKGKEKSIVHSMVSTAATLTRSGFINGDISTVMSPRTVINLV